MQGGNSLILQLSVDNAQIRKKFHFLLKQKQKSVKKANLCLWKKLIILYSMVLYEKDYPSNLL